MNRRWIQMGGLVGFVAMIMVPIAFSLGSTSLKGDSTASQIASAYASHRAGAIVGGILVVAAGALLLWFGATLAWLLHTEDRRSPAGLIALAGIGGMVVFMSWDGVSQILLAFLSTQRGAEASAVMPALEHIQNGLVMPGAFGFMTAVFLSAVGAAALRGAFAARWVGYLAFVLAAVSVSGACLGLSQVNGGTNSPLSYSPAVGATLLAVVASVYMLRYRPAPM